jgi:hypothetical protein
MSSWMASSKQVLTANSGASVPGYAQVANPPSRCQRVEQRAPEFVADRCLDRVPIRNRS